MYIYRFLDAIASTRYKENIVKSMNNPSIQTKKNDKHFFNFLLNDEIAYYLNLVLKLLHVQQFSPLSPFLPKYQTNYYIMNTYKFCIHCWKIPTIIITSWLRLKWYRIGVGRYFIQLIIVTIIIVLFYYWLTIQLFSFSFLKYFISG